jgi:hypothetical protein
MTKPKTPTPTTPASSGTTGRAGASPTAATEPSVLPVLSSSKEPGPLRQDDLMLDGLRKVVARK